MSVEIEIKQKEVGHKGKFYIEVNGRQAAEMTYSMAGATKMIINHTEVGDELRGTGAGAKMVLAAVNKAREKGFKILPLCPFANAQFKKHTEYHDVLA